MKEKVSLVEKFVDHPNRVLRSEAQYAVVSINGAEGLKFVPKLKSPISEWEQLVLLEKLVKFKLEEIPNVKSWMSSKNDSVVIFATKIIHQFRLFDHQQELLSILHHTNSFPNCYTIPVILTSSILCSNSLQATSYFS